MQKSITDEGIKIIMEIIYFLIFFISNRVHQNLKLIYKVFISIILSQGYQKFQDKKTKKNIRQRSERSR